MEERYKYLAARLGSLKEKRAPFEAVWDKAAELCALNSAIYTVSNDGRIIRNIFDSTGRTALTSFAASMKSLIAPSNTRYHRLKASNPAMAGNDNATRYLEYATDLCFKFRYQADSRFSSESDLLFNSLGVFGHDVFLTDDNPGRGIYYRSIPVREAFIDTNRHNLVDVVYREFCLTARDAVREFGKDTPAKIVREYERDPASKRAFTFVHCVEPREEFNPRYKDSYNMPVASYTICRDEDMLISESGYRVMPYAVPRYMIRDNSPYGDSPAMQAFYDILTANEMGKTFLRAGQLQANPGLLTSMDNGAARAGQPGAVVKGGLDGNGRPRVVPMQYGNNLSITLEMQERYRQIIETAFLKPLFLSLLDNTRQMTATEVSERKAERGMLLAPMSERITSEWLNAVVRRELDIIASYGLLDDVPDELAYDGAIAIEFESPAVHLQDAGKVAGMYQTIEGALSLAAIAPNVVDVIDADETLRALAQYRDATTKIIRTPEKVAEIRQAKAQAVETQQLLDAAPVVSQTIKNLGGAGA